MDQVSDSRDPLEVVEGMRKQELVRGSEPLLSVAEGRLKLDAEATAREAVQFIEELFVKSRASGIVVGLSGGVDSGVTCALSTRAVGPEKVLGILLFESKDRTGRDFEDAKLIANQLRIETLDFDLDHTIGGFLLSSPIHSNDRVVLGNLKARARMTSLYFVANERNLLVAGTGDRSEDLIGYFTKYGDGGVDFLPIAHLYKSQVRELGKHLGLPNRIVDKPSSPNLWEGHKATDEIPMDYEILDRALVCLFDLKIPPHEVAKNLNIEIGKINEILSRYRSSEHKRVYPPMVRSW